ncbi:AAA family ATPase [Tenacibaculum finnmarkense]|uniref:AAA family ATPase n=1 Tax=Tenacibaculum finnmarkense TaxID=2781243 RepID=UPI00187B2B23|nr:AAA family ATPase [Tenacibaculum finnmarkense]MBE7691426.1 AAA family ATPase [Tenacibaculum finnmarkense genomovar finnmarkense]
MLIKRIKAKNFKTYLNLDLDISVEDDKPIILIGGVNGGGKTTFFEAIYGALYGLNITTAKAFRELLNAGAVKQTDEKIELDLHFSGRVLNEEQEYILSRTYILNTAGKPVESVKLNMNGTIFNYGTATPISQRAEQETQVNKIIKANLPQELSRYFLFDAMEAGNLLKEDQLNRVIKENIENVMGFNKYMQLASCSENLYQIKTAQRLEIENEKKEYLELVESKNKLKEVIINLNNNLGQSLNYSVQNKELYDNLKNGLNEETTINSKIEQTKLGIENTLKKEEVFRRDLTNFLKEIELNICIPKVQEALKNEIQLILKVKKEVLNNNTVNLPVEQIESISNSIIKYLEENELTIKPINTTTLVNYIVNSTSNIKDTDVYAFLEHSDIKSLESLLNIKTVNNFPVLERQKIELNSAIQQITAQNTFIEQMKAQVTGRDYSILKAYEDNETKIKDYEIKITEKEIEVKKIEAKIHQFDIQISQEPDLKYDTLGKLKGFFEDVANQLLIVKKQQIESKMKQDLNIILAAYKDVIDRVELSENLSNLTFKIFHKSGNEIYLNHLNTASKQIVIQVLLKSLHQFGDYDPPVMIDTVMGVLSEESRAAVLEHYFPQLAHQTILLSSDSEIRKGTEFEKIAPFISKTYTLQRDREKQLTKIIPGYFGIDINV